MPGKKHYNIHNKIIKNLSIKDLRRFLNFISESDRKGCMNWKATLMHKGYGHFVTSYDDVKTQYRAHRLMYELFVGKIPKDKFVLHKCDNRKCVNPEHLFLGTPKENTKDMYNKKRACIGEKHKSSLLKDKDIIKIRKLYSKGFSQSGIARKYLVSQGTIFSIVHRKTWKHIK